jgi:hypothetical protein
VMEENWSKVQKRFVVIVDRIKFPRVAFVF